MKKKQGDMSSKANLHSAEMIVDVTFKPASPLNVYTRPNDRHAVSWNPNATVLKIMLIISMRTVSDGTI
jgi:hypothetical protein